MNDQLFAEFAEIYKALAHPKRIEIIYQLKKSELAAKELSAALNIGKAHLFQHVSILVENRVINVRRKGVQVFYSLADDKVLDALKIMRQLVLKKLKNSNRLLNKAKEYKL